MASEIASHTPSSDEEDYHSAAEDAGGVAESSGSVAVEPAARTGEAECVSGGEGLELGGEGGSANVKEDQEENVKKLDNLCVSEDQEGGGARGERVELSEEQIKVCRTVVVQLQKQFHHQTIKQIDPSVLTLCLRDVHSGWIVHYYYYV